MSSYIPHKGDFVRLSFNPQSGHEQWGRRPALVISNTKFNISTRLAMVCPITSTYRNLPFHVNIPSESSITGYIMVEQIKSVDYDSRQVQFLEKSPTWLLDNVLRVLEVCIFSTDT